LDAVAKVVLNLTSPGDGVAADFSSPILSSASKKSGQSVGMNVVELQQLTNDIKSMIDDSSNALDATDRHKLTAAHDAVISGAAPHANLNKIPWLYLKIPLYEKGVLSSRFKVGINFSSVISYNHFFLKAGV